MAGLILGNVAGAIVKFLNDLKNLLLEALRWLKQAILKLFSYVKAGISKAVDYEKSVVTTLAREVARNQDLLYPVMFATLFDFIGVNE